ncbi:helix-turn-helix domain-containing protein [Vallitalea sp.]|uniref:helix-turn-helix domain-containing protein n=1 Tax=Vallitalea sp. TaxID=1882829 RepID=UPI003FCD68E4
MVQSRRNEKGDRRPRKKVYGYVLKIKEIRESKNISLNKLSKISGVSKSTLYQIENNDSKPYFDTIYKISRALKVKIDDLVDGIS